MLLGGTGLVAGLKKGGFTFSNDARCQQGDIRLSPQQGGRQKNRAQIPSSHRFCSCLTLPGVTIGCSIRCQGGKLLENMATMLLYGAQTPSHHARRTVRPRPRRSSKRPSRFLQ